VDALAGPLLCDPARKAELETRNGDDRLDYITDLVDSGARELRESHVLALQSMAVREIYPCGGRYRDVTKGVFIQNSKHQLPDAAFAPSLVRDAVDWINRETHRSALERAAYALWSFNWVHPFAGGNGAASPRPGVPATSNRHRERTGCQAPEATPPEGLSSAVKATRR
jgi:fido (protein-threonine AMPylation protein)